jgi:hypothetical protein
MTNRHITILLFFLLFVSNLTYADFPGQFSGELSIESRFFSEEGIYDNNKKIDASFSIMPEYSYSWDQDRKVFTFVPYFKYSELDEDKTHGDIRELSFVGSYGQLELRAGISKVFWGVTESLHLIDVVNQTDFVENIDTEDKLGQPMVNATIVTSYGNVSAFLLPYFRERTFAGTNGRLRGAVNIDNNNELYSHVDNENHIDYAFRWSHYYDAFEWGISFFKGTDRISRFILNESETLLTPFYVQTEQVSLDLQYVYENWLFKSEVLRKDSQFEKKFHATVTGFEYTFSNIKGKGIDIGVLYEWIYDERKGKSDFGLSDASFFGTRVALNDENSTEFLIGGTYDHYNSDLAFFRLEGSRRINDTLKWELELSVYNNPVSVSFFYQIRKYDYLQFTLFNYC